MAADRAAGERRTWKGAVVAVAIGVVLTAVLAELALRTVMPHWSEFYSGRFMRMETLPGYDSFVIGRAGFDSYFAQNNGDFRVHIAINGFGLRNPEPVSAAAGRVWVVGDSMAFGWGVEQPQTYTTIAQRESARPSYNVASPGTDVCGYQALIARMPKTVRPSAVVVGLVLENDVKEYDCPRGDAAVVAPAQTGGGGPSLLDLKRFLTARLALYNFFAVAAKRVDAVNRALIALGLVRRQHREKGRLDPDRIAAVAGSTADELAAVRSMLPAATPFAVLIAPARWEIRDRDALHRRLRVAVASALAARGIAAIDPFDAFAAAGFGPTHFAHDGHWSPLGHEIAGKAVAAWLRSVAAPKD